MTTPSQRPTLPAPVDPRVAEIDAIADLLDVWAHCVAPADDRSGTVRRLAAEAVYDLRRAAIAAGLPGAQRVGRSVLEPKMVTRDGAAVPARSAL